MDVLNTSEIAAEIQLILLGLATLIILFTETDPHIRAITIIASLGFSGVIWATLSINKER